MTDYFLRAPVHVEELEHLRCGNPDCSSPECSSTLALIPVCHPLGGIYAEYVKAEEALRVSCDYCRAFIISLKIARLPAEKKQ